MIWFLLIFLAVYTGLHLIFYRGVRCLLPAGAGPRVLVWLFFSLMILAPMLTVLAGAWGHPRAARLVGAVGYWWMGFLLMGLLCLLALDLLRLMALPFSPRPWDWRMPVFLALGAAFILTAYAGWAATQVRLTRVTIPTAKLPPGVERLVMVQTGDLHLGLPGGVGRLARTLKLVREARPDLWVDTGDLWDRPLLDAPRLVAMMRAVRPPLGKYAVSGNHEHYVGLSTAMGLTRAAGFTFLANQGQPVGRALNLAGVISSRHIRPASEAAALAGLAPERFTVFLRHRPLVSRAALGRVDLQLSGHTHGGQVWPFHYLVKAVYPLMDGLRELGQGMRLYTTRGAGTWGPPLRLFAPPEVARIELVRRPSR